MLNPDYRAAQALFADAAEPALSGRIVAVVGATGGLGTALCKALARADATVVMLGRKLQRLEQLYDAIEPLGSCTPAMAELDLARLDREGAQAVAEMLFAEFGRLDALVLAAVDGGTPAPQLEIDDAQFARVMQVNVAAQRTLIAALTPLLAHSPDASLVTLLDHRPGAYSGVYGLSKQAMHALMHQLADESEHAKGADGAPRLAINGYDPGPVRTPLRRRFFAGEHASESPAPDDRLAPLLHLIARTDRSLTGAALAWISDAMA